MEKGKYYLTTAIAYTSGKPHIGNTYEIILSDAIARYKRMVGYDVFFQTGTDEHGQKIEEKAKVAGVNPQKFVDDIANMIKENYALMNISYDYFVRTTDDNHVKIVQEIFKKLYDQKDIYKSTYEGWYCTDCESFYTESQLVDEKCPDCGATVHKASEEAYFFNLQKYADRLIDHIEKNPEFIQPESRKNEMLNNFIKPGLQDLCVSRTSFKWGIPVSFDNKHVVYVWIDALSNYITSLGYDVDGNHGELYKKYWPADVHVIGKDILRFHTIYWPIMLMALNQPLPKQVFGHPWLLVGSGKMSKSKGNSIYADELVKYFGVDATRYYCLTEMPFAQDGTITWELMIERINSDLANVLGNLVSRSVSMCNKYFEGVIPQAKDIEPLDQELIDCALAVANKVDKKLDELRVGDAIDEIFVLLKRCNKYVDETAPWVLAKEEDKSRLQSVIYHLLECIRIAAVQLVPFIPASATKILDQLNTNKREYETCLNYGHLEVSNRVIEKPEILFQRIDAEKMLKEIEEAHTVVKKETKPEISIDDFDKIELRVGQVLSCEKHQKADKLLISQVDMGDGEVRQIVSSIATHFTAEEMVGKKVIVVCNLKTATIRGTESQGMLLVGETPNDEQLVLASCDLPNGSIVR